MNLVRSAAALDAFLMRVDWGVRVLVIAATIAHMTWLAIPHVPRAYVDYRDLPLVSGVEQMENYGTDTIADMYAAKVVLNDPHDMYRRERLAQTPLERATWTREASAPYPPAALLAAAGLYAVGSATGLEYYGMVLVLAVVFLGLSLRFFLQTRWYLFPLLYLNFSYFASRFVYVQDGSYLAMLVVVMIALALARSPTPISHLLMAVATTMKVSPIGYVWQVFEMRRRTASAFIAILITGFVVPYFIWDNYLYIYTFHEQLKGNVYDTIAAVVVVVPFTIALRYIEVRLGFDLEDRIGWALVPFAMFLGLKMRVARHLLIVLLVPDKRGPRNLVAATGLGLYALPTNTFRLGSVLYISVVLLCVTLAYYLRTIGWDVVRDDLRHWRRTARLIVRGRETAAR